MAPLKHKYYVALMVGLLFITIQSFSQKQLVLMKNQDVVLRFNPGDEFVFKLKNSKSIHRSYVNNLSDTAVVTHSDLIPYHTIDKIYFYKSRFYNRLGTVLFGGGIMLFVGDQINVTLIQGDKASLDRGVSITSLAMVGAGLPMMLIKKKSQRVRHHFHLMMVEKGSPFYEEDHRDALDE